MERFKDLTGQRYGKLIALRKIGTTKHRHALWLCKCDCGNEKVANSLLLQQGKIKSCGCLPKGNFEDLTGQKFNRLTVIKRMENDKYHNTKWLCRCDCGKEVIVYALALKNGDTNSCGCLKKDLAKEKFSKHGLSKTRIYKTWIHIKERCINPKKTGFEYYGGRGIEICQEWLNFENFYEWSIKNGYANNLTIDRINVNGNYEPSNCRWATQKEQANNKRNNHFITYNNETHTIAEWAEILNMKASTLHSRIALLNWSIEKSFKTPIMNRIDNKKGVKLCK